MKNDVPFKIGCSAYYNRHWKDIFYPPEIPSSQWFIFYCQHFNTIELNSTFYKFPTSQSLQTWYKKSPDNFMFSVKAPRQITHYKKFKGCESLLEDFYAACQEGLKEKLGCLLFQFPPSVAYNPEKLNQIITAVLPVCTNVVEFRHPSWWTSQVYTELAAHQITFCSVNHPTLPDDIVANSSTAYIRLHGNPEVFFSSYSPDQLLKLYRSIRNLPEIKEIYVYFNNTASVAGVLNPQLLQRFILEPENR